MVADHMAYPLADRCLALIAHFCHFFCELFARFCLLTLPFLPLYIIAELLLRCKPFLEGHKGYLLRYNPIMKYHDLKDRITDIVGTIGDLIILGISLGLVLTIAILIAGSIMICLIDSGNLG